MAKDFLRTFFSVKMLIIFLHGFAQGLPFILIGSTLKTWMAREGIALSTVTYFTWTSIPYSWKFLWSAFLDHYNLTRLGRRRSWMFLTQVLLTLLIFALGTLNPNIALVEFALIATAIGFLSATQDIAIDAYRREYLEEKELGLGSSVVQYGFRVAMLLGGGIGISMVDPATINLSWSQLYMIMAGFMGLVAISTLFIPEPEASQMAQVKSFRQAIIEPFREFMQRDGAVYILLFVFLFKLGDAMAGAPLNPFYVEMGYSNYQIGLIAKTYGLFSSLLGLFIGGTAIFYFGIYRCLWIFGILQALSTAAFTLVYYFAPAVWPLAVAVLFEDFSAGMGAAAFVAFITAICNVRFSATQFALLSSIATLGRNLLSGWSGKLVELIGWEVFFYSCALAAIPGLAMLIKMRKFQDGVTTEQ